MTDKGNLWEPLEEAGLNSVAIQAIRTAIHNDVVAEGELVRKRISVEIRDLIDVHEGNCLHKNVVSTDRPFEALNAQPTKETKSIIPEPESSPKVNSLGSLAAAFLVKIVPKNLEEVYPPYKLESPGTALWCNEELKKKKALEISVSYTAAILRNLFKAGKIRRTRVGADGQGWFYIYYRYKSHPKTAIEQAMEANRQTILTSLEAGIKQAIKEPPGDSLEDLKRWARTAGENVSTEILIDLLRQRGIEIKEEVA